MYSRQMSEAPDSLVKKGKPVFGTFQGPVKRLDIRGLKAPFGVVPLPSFFTNFRIKSSLTFSFNMGQFFCSIIFFDAKIFGLAEVDLWNTETGRKYVYKSIMGPRRRFIPHNMMQGFTASFNPHRYIRISWDHQRDRFSAIFNIKGDSVRPSIQAALTGHLNDAQNCEVSQNVPVKSKRRCSASYMATPIMRGSLTIGQTKKTPGTTYNTDRANGLFFISRSYYDYITQTQLIHAEGVVDGKNISFVIENAAEDSIDGEFNNRNMLIVDGQATPLPPVRMTHPYGIDKKWVIQDTENMVDLTFDPASMHNREINVFVNKIRLSILFGKFEGVLKTKEGADIKISGLCGNARDQMLRV